MRVKKTPKKIFGGDLVNVGFPVPNIDIIS